MSRLLVALALFLPPAARAEDPTTPAPTHASDWDPSAFHSVHGSAVRVRRRPRVPEAEAGPGVECLVRFYIDERGVPVHVVPRESCPEGFRSRAVEIGQKYRFSPYHGETTPRSATRCAFDLPVTTCLFPKEFLRTIPACKPYAAPPPPTAAGTDRLHAIVFAADDWQRLPGGSSGWAPDAPTQRLGGSPPLSRPLTPAVRLSHVPAQTLSQVVGLVPGMVVTADRGVTTLADGGGAPVLVVDGIAWGRVSGGR
jgi:hypothetical protein